MNKNKLKEIKTDYDIQSITQISIKRAKNNILKLVLSSTAFVISLVTSILFHSCWLIFVLATSTACISCYLSHKNINSLKCAHYRNTFGTVVEVSKDRVMIKDGIRGVPRAFKGLSGEKKYDTYTRHAIKITVYINENNKVVTFHFPLSTEKHANYYDERGMMLHIYGTTYPVKVQVGTNDWLCPICGQFNPIKEKNCNNCNNRIIKYSDTK